MLTFDEDDNPLPAESKVLTPQEEQMLSQVKQMISFVGDDPDREGLEDTPARVVRSWREIYKGYNEDPAEILGVTFEAEQTDELVLCKDIEFFSTCEHHIIPIIGTAHVAYIPNGRVVGLSKLARLVDCFARRLQIQEKMTSQIAQALYENLDARGVGVIVKARHMCMSSRGVRKGSSWMTTSCMLGNLKTDADRRSEFFKFCEM